MKFYYFYFKEYSKIDPKVRDQFLFLSTAYTVPSYWNGLEFTPFVPSKELFYDACIDFKTSQFEERYKCQIYSLNLHDIFNELKQMSNGATTFDIYDDKYNRIAIVGENFELYIDPSYNKLTCEDFVLMYQRPLEVVVLGTTPPSKVLEEERILQEIINNYKA